MSYKVNVQCRKNSNSFAYNSKYTWLSSCMVYLFRARTLYKISTYLSCYVENEKNKTRTLTYLEHRNIHSSCI